MLIRIETLSVVLHLSKYKLNPSGLVPSADRRRLNLGNLPQVIKQELGVSIKVGKSSWGAPQSAGRLDLNLMCHRDKLLKQFLVIYKHD